MNYHESYKSMNIPSINNSFADFRVSWKTKSISLHLWIQKHESMLSCLCTAIIKIHENQVIWYRSILSYICTAIIKVHENQVTWYRSILSYICTAIIKVHEDQVKIHESMFYAFVLQLSRYMKIRWQIWKYDKNLDNSSYVAFHVQQSASKF